MATKVIKDVQVKRSDGTIETIPIGVDANYVVYNSSSSGTAQNIISELKTSDENLQTYLLYKEMV